MGTHHGYDRVTFQFVPRTPPPPAPPDLLPKYEVTKVSSVIQDGSGEPVEVAGKSFLQVVFHGATGVRLDGEQVERIYQGPKEFKPNFPRLAEVQDAGDFEATLTWGLGLKEPTCPKVTELKNPLRVAIDVPH